MYFNFNFDRDSAFFDHSIGFKLIKCKLQGFEDIGSINSTLVEICIKLWMESIIKHNLDMYLGKFDYLNLISEENSTDVFNTFGKIMWKDKNSITHDDNVVLYNYRLIQEHIQSIMYELSYDNVDLCNEIKKEFMDFKN